MARVRDYHPTAPDQTTGVTLPWAEVKGKKLTATEKVQTPAITDGTNTFTPAEVRKVVDDGGLPNGGAPGDYLRQNASGKGEWTGLPIANESAPGIIKPDGTSIVVDAAGVASATVDPLPHDGAPGDVLGLNDSGVPAWKGIGQIANSIPKATETTLGVVKPDGATILVDADGTISAIGGGGGEGGTTDHRAQQNRNAPKQHLTSSVYEVIDSADVDQATINAGFRTGIASNNSAISNVALELAEVDAELAAIDTDLTTLDSDVSGLKTDMTAVQGRIGTLETGAGETSTTLTALAGTVSAQGGQITAAAGKITALETQAAAAGESIETLQNTAAGLTTATANLNIRANVDGILTKTDTVWTLAATLPNPLPAMVTVRAVATGDFEAGDTLKVNATGFELFTPAMEALPAGAWKDGGGVELLLDTGEGRHNAFFKLGGGGGGGGNGWRIYTGDNPPPEGQSLPFALYVPDAAGVTGKFIDSEVSETLPSYEESAFKEMQQMVTPRGMMGATVRTDQAVMVAGGYATSSVGTTATTEYFPMQGNSFLAGQTMPSAVGYNEGCTTRSDGAVHVVRGLGGKESFASPLGTGAFVSSNPLLELRMYGGGCVRKDEAIVQLGGMDSPLTSELSPLGTGSFVAGSALPASGMYARPKTNNEGHIQVCSSNLNYMYSPFGTGTYVEGGKRIKARSGASCTIRADNVLHVCSSETTSDWKTTEVLRYIDGVFEASPIETVVGSSAPATVVAPITNMLWILGGNNAARTAGISTTQGLTPAPALPVPYPDGSLIIKTTHSGGNRAKLYDDGIVSEHASIDKVYQVRDGSLVELTYSILN